MFAAGLIPFAEERPMIVRMLLALVAIALSAGASFAAEAIKPAEFDRIHAVIQPQQTESAWLSIPWHTDLWEARQLAAKEGKPILLWEMDGHPLGCT
jgi:hypothetical protein